LRNRIERLHERVHSAAILSCLLNTLPAAALWAARMQSDMKLACWTKGAAAVSGLMIAAQAWSSPMTPLSAFSFAQTPSTPVQRHGLLKASNGAIVNDKGQKTSLAGMSLFWSQWIGKYYTPDTVSWLKKDWQISIIRAAVAVEGGGYLTNPDAEMAKAKTVIDAAIKEGLYVIVDWHDHKAEAHSDQAVEFFTKIASEYGGKPNLIYEIYNEPLKVSWSKVIKPYAEKVFKAIRAKDPDNLIVVGTPTWSQDVDAAALDPIKDPNVAYSLHIYAGTHKQWLRDKAITAMQKGLALFVTEWGTVDSSGNGAIDHASTKEWLEFMKEHSISHCNWSIADKVESSAALKPGASPEGGWKDEELTDSGRMVREIIRGWSR